MIRSPPTGASRKPMPPPGKTIPDKRRKLDEEDAQREVEEGR